MKWFNSKDKLPSDQQEVLIRKKGAVNLGKYDKATGTFRLRDGSVLPVESAQIEWMELVAPEQGR